MMASGRMLRAQISLSPQVNDLSLKGALLFTWLIPHVDDFGRIYADPRRLKAKIFPMRDDISVKEMSKLLNEMEDKSLIILYSIEGENYLQLTKFDEHQQGLHKRTKSKLPSPQPALNKDSGKFREIPKNSHPTRTEQNRTEQEQEQEQEGQTSSPKILEIFEFWKITTGQEKAVLDKKRKSKIEDALKKYSVEDLKKAIAGNKNDKWHAEREVHELKYILRDSANIEKFLAGRAKNDALSDLGYVGPE